MFLTHAHDDHDGFLNDVLAITDAKVILHPKAIEGLLKGQNSFEGGCSSRLAWLFCQVLALFGKGEHKYPPLKEEYRDRLITIDSAEFKELKLPFSVIETPGHTTDHIAMIMDGTVTVSPQKEAYHTDERVELTATPAEGWRFAGWHSRYWSDNSRCYVYNLRVMDDCRPHGQCSR